MREVEDINWNVEMQLMGNPCNEKKIKKSCWIVSFTYNGYELEAYVDFELYFDIIEETETNKKESEISDVTVKINSVCLEGSCLKLDVKELINIQNQLETDLKIQF